MENYKSEAMLNCNFIHFHTNKSDSERMESNSTYTTRKQAKKKKKNCMQF